MVTLTPNSYGVRALPFEKHSTSGACSACSLRPTARCTRPTRRRRVRNAFFIRLNYLACA